MRWAREGFIAAIGLFMLAANIQPASAQGQEKGKRIVREERDPASGAVMTGTMDHDVARTTVKVRDLVMEKAIAATGETTVRLSQGRDLVTIALRRDGVEIQRNGRSVRLQAGAVTEDDADQVRTLLTGSSAVRAFRAVGALMEQREVDGQEGPLFHAALIDAGIVGALDGDPGALPRSVKRATAGRRALLRQARFRPAFDDCMGLYEIAVLSAYDQFGDCYMAVNEASWYLQYFLLKFCSFEWVVRAEQYTFQFLQCMTFNF